MYISTECFPIVCMPPTALTSILVCVTMPVCTPVQLIMEVLKKVEGAYALLFKSTHYPGELVACKRGSPLILGIKVGTCVCDYLLGLVEWEVGTCVCDCLLGLVEWNIG